MRTRFQGWLKQISGGMSELAIAKRMGVNPSTVNRHLFDPKKAPVAQTVIDFCVTFGVNPAEGLIEAGLAPAEMFTLPMVDDRSSIGEALHAATNSQLVQELSRRLLDTEHRDEAQSEARASRSRPERVARGLLS
ncbi:hypothetical protein ACFXHA_12780 [Nocardia sp. NPDC059240]|uniref:hypothetical protein n=1 Tax=Nocardia sp. NPDC059240 TaxID=3346786 RepID=UPI0036868F6A